MVDQRMKLSEGDTYSLCFYLERENKFNGVVWDLLGALKKSTNTKKRSFPILFCIQLLL